VTAAGPALRAQQSASAAPASQADQGQPYVDELPGMGRPVDTAATALRRAHLLRRLGEAVALIPAARLRDIETDYIQDNDFRQSNTFFYFTQLEQPAAWLVLIAHSAGSAGAGATGAGSAGARADSAVLLLPDRVPAMERWTGVRLGPGELAQRLTGIVQVLSVTKLDSILAAQRARGVPIYAPADRYSIGLPPYARLRADTTVNLHDLRPIVDSMRQVKDAAELAALRHAIAITAEAQRDVAAAIEPGMFEYQAEAVLEGTFRRLGADRVGFPSIVGSGPNSTTLHYDVNRRRMNGGETVVVDIGAEWGQYTADVTRTWPVSGTFTPHQRAVYELVLATNQAVLDSVRPGITLARLNGIAREYMRIHSGATCDTVTCDRYFIHGVTHHLGMDVHDVGPMGLPLAAGMVITDEPGIYIPQEALGVRIEDDVLVTATGHELLSASAPRTVVEVERAMQRTPANVRRPAREE
jgi:Xaa-Pro aminopeptidase